MEGEGENMEIGHGDVLGCDIFTTCTMDREAFKFRQ
jgi:hypothetical protein